MMVTHKKVLLAAALVAVAFSPSAFAGMIANTPAPAVSGPGLGFADVPVVLTLNIDNDNQDGATPMDDNNILVPQKRFDVLGSNPAEDGYIDIVFTVEPTNGVSEYRLVEFVDNNTGVNWIGYEMLLGFGTGDDFTKSTVGDGLDFDAGPPGGLDPAPTSLPFSSIVLTDEDTLTFSGGVQGGGAQPYSFRIDVPNLPAGFDSFTLRQYPVPVPEPATVSLAALFALAAIGLGARRR